MSEFRMGLVGCGAIAERHGKAALTSGAGVRFVACADINADNARAWAERYVAERHYTDFEEMIRSERLDGVLFATWPNHHGEQIARAVAAGARSILCEKALTLTGRDAETAFATCEAAGVPLVEAFMYLHHPTVRLLDALMAEPARERVDSVRAVFAILDRERQEANDDSRVWRQRKDTGGGIPYDLVPYCVNACGRYAASLPRRVHAIGDYSEKYGTLVRLFGTVEYENGCVGIIQSGKRQGFSQFLEINAVDSVFRLNLPFTPRRANAIEQTFFRTNGDTLDISHPIPDEYGDDPGAREIGPYRDQLDRFAAFVRGEAPPLPHISESIVNTHVIEALVASVDAGQAVEISLSDQLRRKWGQARGQASAKAGVSAGRRCPA